MSDSYTRNLIRYGGHFMPGLVASAQGAYVRMEDGRQVLDFTSGQMSGILGHSHPAIVECIQRQSETLVHLFSGMLSQPVVELAGRLADLLPRTRVWPVCLPVISTLRDGAQTVLPE